MAKKPRPKFKKIPKDILSELGALVMAASAADHQIAHQILRLISPLHFVAWHAWAIVFGMDFKVKLSVVRMIVAQLDKEHRDYITECCDELQKLYQKRNDLAHSLYVGTAKKGYATFVSMRPDPTTGVPKQPFHVSTTQIHDWGKKLVEWSFEIDETLTDLGYPFLPPSQDDVGERPPPDETEATRPEPRIRRTTRKKQRPSDRRPKAQKDQSEA